MIATRILRPLVRPPCRPFLSWHFLFQPFFSSSAVAMWAIRWMTVMVARSATTATAAAKS
jgi:hypothetical protein